MPPKDTQLSELQGAPMVSDYNLITSKASRKANSVDGTETGFYSDAWNQARMAQYNNDYNYWLWKQQAEYNSPSNQVARLREAGLNPNFNSIDGTGNLGSMPTSSGSISPSIGKNRNMQFQQILGAANTALQAFNDGVKNLSQLSDLPPISRIGEYRDLLVEIGYERLKGSRLTNFIRTVDGIANAALSGFDVSTLKDAGLFTDNLSIPVGKSAMIKFDPDKVWPLKTVQEKLKALGLDIDIKGLVKHAKDYYNKEIQPSEAAIKKGQAGNLSSGQLFQKIANGEDLSIGQWVIAILQYISNLITLKPL